VGKKRRLKVQGQREEIVPTVSIPVAETYAATRADLRKLSNKLQRPVELKWLDTYAANAAPAANTATTVALSLVPQAATSVTRVGASCQITSLQARLNIHMAAANAVGSPPSLRVLFLIDNEVNGGLPAVADVLDNTIITDLTLAPFNLSQLGQRFKILYDWRGHMPITARDATFYVYGEINLNFKKAIRRKLQFTPGSTSGAIGTCIKNSLIMILLTDTAGPLFNYGTRMIFKDD